MSNVVGSYSSTIQPAAVGSGGWWVKDPLDPTRNVRTANGDGDWSSEDGTRSSVFEPLGRSLPVVTHGVVGGERLQLTWHVPDETVYASLELLRLSRRTLLVQSPGGESRYVQVVGPRTQAYFLTPTGQRKRRVTWSLVEVERPA